MPETTPDRRPAATRRSGRRSQQERTRETREKLIAATIDCIAELGYASTTVAAIAQRAAVSVGAFQHQFADKDDLIVAALDTIFEQVHRFLTTVDGAEGSLDDKVGAIVGEYWEGFGNPTYLVAWEIIAASKTNPALHARVREQSLHATRAAFALWRRVFAAERVPDEALYDILVMTLSSLRGLSFLQLVDNRPEEIAGKLGLLRIALAAQLRACGGCRAGAGGPS